MAEAEPEAAHRRPAALHEPGCRSPRSAGRGPSADRPRTRGERGEARRRREDTSAVSASSPVVAAACPMTLPGSHHPHLVSLRHSAWHRLGGASPTFTKPRIARDPAPVALRVRCSRGRSPHLRKHTRRPRGRTRGGPSRLRRTPPRPRPPCATSGSGSSSASSTRPSPTPRQSGASRRHSSGRAATADVRPGRSRHGPRRIVGR